MDDRHMSIHQRTHPEPQRDCFACKLVGIHFGIVPGAYRDTNSSSMFDRDQLLTQFSDKDGEPVFSEERVKDSQSDFARKRKDFLEA